MCCLQRHRGLLYALWHGSDSSTWGTHLFYSAGEGGNHVDSLVVGAGKPEAAPVVSESEPYPCLSAAIGWCCRSRIGGFMVLLLLASGVTQALCVPFILHSWLQTAGSSVFPARPANHTTVLQRSPRQNSVHTATAFLVVYSRASATRSHRGRTQRSLILYHTKAHRRQQHN